MGGPEGWLVKSKLQYAGVVVCQASDEFTTNVTAEIECDWRQKQHGIAI